ncbi:unnamed protein product, partial [marine sediment metagenome]
MKSTLIKRVTKLLDIGLTHSQSELMRLVSIEDHRGVAIFRIPIGVTSLEDMWSVLLEICEKNNIKCRKADKFASLSELDDLLSGIEWLWQDWIPLGFLTLLVGDPGGGKSMAALDWARITICGEKFPMAEKGSKKECVLWIEAEA